MQYIDLSLKGARPWSIVGHALTKWSWTLVSSTELWSCPVTFSHTHVHVVVYLFLDGSALRAVWMILRTLLRRVHWSWESWPSSLLSLRYVGADNEASLPICDRIWEKGPLGAECWLLVGYSTLKYSSWASYCSLFCVCSCFHCWDMCIWKLRFVLLVYVHARLFEPIAEIVVLREVGPFLKSSITYGIVSIRLQLRRSVHVSALHK